MGSLSITRPAVQAGRFYPASADALGRKVEQFLEDGATSLIQDPKAVIAPHAGYSYSGPIAGSAFAPWVRNSGRCRRVVLLGPSHFVDFNGLALPPQTAWSTPLGTSAVDTDAIESLRGFSFVRVFGPAHEREHCLEVELPFLQAIFRDVTLVPLVVGRARDEDIAEVLDALWSGESTRVVISSDLSHYLDYEAAMSMDHDTAEIVERRDAVPLTPERACGFRAIRGLLRVAKKRDLKIATVDLRNSGDNGGSRDSVVGYGAFHLDAT
ncbi:MAG: AmmeMemoRadiSam system protein B [Verrucomicrobiales bacterium]|nr:AmmeMemoRadiSam system protein B [Verrucomicrobiales bacterium]